MPKAGIRVTFPITYRTPPTCTHHNTRICNLIFVVTTHGRDVYLFIVDSSDMRRLTSAQFLLKRKMLIEERGTSVTREEKARHILERLCHFGFERFVRFSRFTIKGPQEEAKHESRSDT